ncbi:MAG: hypothetical protein JNM81_16385, partial [Rhodospirillaceae bacterium]|nr:hypothetical protein [Rhodospirillaceae bacterium]
ETAPVATEPDVTDERPPRRERDQGRERGRDRDRERGDRDRGDRDNRRNRNSRDKWARDAGEMDHDDDVLGFGAAIPAFLQVAPSLPQPEADDLPPITEEE